MVWVGTVFEYQTHKYDSDDCKGHDCLALFRRLDILHAEEMSFFGIGLFLFEVENVLELP